MKVLLLGDSKLDRPQGTWATRNGIEWDIWSYKGDEEFWHPQWPANVKWTINGGNGLIRVESSDEWKWDKRYDLMRRLK